MSRLYNISLSSLSADEYTDVFDNEVWHLFDEAAPIRTALKHMLFDFGQGACSQAELSFVVTFKRATKWTDDHTEQHNGRPNNLSQIHVQHTWHVIACTPSCYCCIEQARSRLRMKQTQRWTTVECVFSIGHAKLYGDWSYQSTRRSSRCLFKCKERKEFYARVSTGFTSNSNSFFRRLHQSHHVATHAMSVIITNSINLHLNNQSPSSTISFLKILSGAGLVQLVNCWMLSSRAPTQWFMSSSIRPSKLTTRSFLFRASEESRTRTTVFKREWKALNIDSLRNDLQSSMLYTNLLENVSGFSDAYDQTLRSLPDKHVPTMEALFWSSYSSVWFNPLLGHESCHKMNSYTASWISRTTIVHGTSSSSINRPFPS